MTDETGQSTGRARGESSLRARLRVEPHPDANCGVLKSGRRGEDIKRNEICSDGSCESGCDCRAEVTVTDGDHNRRELVGSTIEPRCVCPAFRQNDCVVTLDSFRDGALFVSVSVPTRRALQDIVEDLRDRGASVHLQRILPLSQDQSGNRTVELDANAITEKQKEAVQTAVREGYYESPRRADLDDLANDLDVSRSAVSQRLNAAERTLVNELTAAGTGTSGGDRVAPTD